MCQPAFAVELQPLTQRQLRRSGPGWYDGSAGALMDSKDEGVSFTPTFSCTTFRPPVYKLPIFGWCHLLGFGQRSGSADQVLLTSRHFAVQRETSVQPTATSAFPSRDFRGNLCFFHQWIGRKCRHCIPPRGEMANPVLRSSYDCWGTRGAAARHSLSGRRWELRRASSILLTQTCHPRADDPLYQVGVFVS